MMMDPLDNNVVQPTPTNSQCCSLKKRWRMAAEEEIPRKEEHDSANNPKREGSQTPTTGVRENSPISSSPDQSSGQESRNSSDGENRHSPNMPNKSQENNKNNSSPDQTDLKEIKKKQTQQCIKVIKHLLYGKNKLLAKDSEINKKLNTVEALSTVIQLLKAEIDSKKWEAPVFDDSQDQNEYNEDTVSINKDSFITLNYPNMTIKSVSENFKESIDYSITDLVNFCLHKFVKQSDINLIINLISNHTRKSAFCRDKNNATVFARFRIGSKGEETVMQIQLCTENANDTKNGEPIYKLLLRPLLQHEKQTKNRILCFHTKHSPKLNFTHVSADVVQTLGYLPQDLIGRSLVAFINPDDLVILEDVHDLVISSRCHPIRSTPFRFRLGDGQEAVLDTEWSSFTNPWTKKIEFIMASHTVIRGTTDLHKTLANSYDTAQTLQEQSTTSSRAIALHSRIVNVLAEYPRKKKQQITRRPPNNISTSPSHETCSKMESVESETTNAKPQTIAQNQPIRGVKRGANNDMCTFLDHLVESIVYAAHSPPKITRPSQPQSPHIAHNNPDVHGGSPVRSAEALSGSPPDSTGSLSYSTINYLEKVHRLLQSQPKAHSSDHSNDKSRTSSPQIQPHHPQNDQQKHATDHNLHENMPLTRELLQQHTQNWEKEYKRRYSSELASVAAAHNAGQSDSINTGMNPGNAWKNVPRVVSLPQLHSSSLDIAPPGPLWSSLNLPPEPINRVVAPKPMPIYNSSELYYRALGPNPPPPPGRNFQVTVAPLPARSSAFIPPPTSAMPMNSNGLKRRGSQEVMHHAPINLTMNQALNQPNAINPQHSINKIPAIQNISPVSNGHWAPPQQMEMQWPAYRPGRHDLSLSEQLIMRYRNNGDQSNNNLNISHSEITPRPVFSDSILIPHSISVPNFCSEGPSAVKEATDALMLLQET